MKKILFSVLVLTCLKSLLFSSSADYHSVGVSTTVTVSTSAWTAIPSTGSINPSRIGVLVSNPEGQNLKFTLRLSTGNLAPSEGITNGFSLTECDGPKILPISSEIKLWAVSEATGTPKQIYVQELLGN